MKLRLLGIGLVLAAMWLTGCAKTGEPVAVAPSAPAAVVPTAPSAQTKELKAQAPVAVAPKKEVFVEGIKAGVDDGTVDGEWFKERIASSKIPSNVAMIDVRNDKEFATGHLKGATNVEAAKLSAADLAAKLPKNKVAIFTCGTGARAMEAYIKLKDGKMDVSKVMYFDANIKCDAKGQCDITVNEPFN